MLALGIDVVRLDLTSLSHDRDRLAYAVNTVEICRRYEVEVLVTDRADLAIASGAAGVHVTGRALGVRVVDRVLGPRRGVAAAAVGLADAVGATDDGARLVAIEPFASDPTGPGHDGADAPIDQVDTEDWIGTIGRVAARIGVPVIAAGPLDPDWCPTLFDLVVDGVEVGDILFSRRVDPIEALIRYGAGPARIGARRR